MKLEVRCCCQPQRLRGWIEVPAHQVAKGRLLRFPLMTHSSQCGRTAIQTVDLEVAVFAAFGDAYLAIKSEDVPIETLRRIRCFKEAPDDWPAA